MGWASRPAIGGRTARGRSKHVCKSLGNPPSAHYRVPACRSFPARRQGAPQAARRSLAAHERLRGPAARAGPGGDHGPVRVDQRPSGDQRDPGDTAARGAHLRRRGEGRAAARPSRASLSRASARNWAGPPGLPAPSAPPSAARRLRRRTAGSRRADGGGSPPLPQILLGTAQPARAARGAGATPSVGDAARPPPWVVLEPPGRRWRRRRRPRLPGALRGLRPCPAERPTSCLRGFLQREGLVVFTLRRQKASFLFVNFF